MKLRHIALALALACGFGTIAEAKTKSAVHKVKVKKPKRPKPPKAPKHAKVKHAKHAKVKHV
jgi:hypothetical protein